MAELWLRLAVDFPTHPKVIQAGPDAAWLAVCAMAYCRKHLTDGLLPAAVVPTLAAVKRPMIVAARLVAVGLWELRPPDAYLVHDFLHWNPSRAEVEANRERWKDKKKNQRSVPGGHTEGQVGGHSRESSESPYVRADAPAPDARSVSDSSLPVVGFMEGGVGETTDVPPVWREPSPRPKTNVEPRRNHAKCFNAPAACARGLCLPQFLGEQWQAQIATGQPEGFSASAVMITRVNAIVDAWPIGKTVDDLLPWWRQQWKFAVPMLEASSTEDWYNECQRLHGGACGSRYIHGTMPRTAVAS